MDITIFVLMGCVVCFCVVLIITVYRLESQVREMKEIKAIIEYDEKINAYNKSIIDKCCEVIELDNKLADSCVDVLNRVNEINNRILDYLEKE